jgi:hypothetical protein
MVVGAGQDMEISWCSIEKQMAAQLASWVFLRFPVFVHATFLPQLQVIQSQGRFVSCLVVQALASGYKGQKDDADEKERQTGE